MTPIGYLMLVNSITNFDNGLERVDIDIPLTAINADIPTAATNTP